MSVYTTIERDELEAFLRTYPLGKLVEYSGITAGIENTNYFVTTTHGQYVLTLFESLCHDELPYFLDLMAHLAEHDVPSAHPEANEHGLYVSTLKQKPAALVRRLMGQSVEQPNPEQCAALGKALGHMHDIGQEFIGQRDNRRGPHWWREMANQLMAHLDEDDGTLLRAELHYQSQHRRVDLLPQGVIHADLFRDNALFENNTLTGIIDFYYACNDVLLYDLAITVNDWCSHDDGSLDPSRLQPMLMAYQAERSLTDHERQAWPVMLRAGALRFWLSRLYDKHFPRRGEITHIKDPNVFKRILQQRMNQQADLGIK